MRIGLYDRLFKVEDGKLVALSTGAGYCAEHECGSESLQSALSAKGSWKQQLARYAKSISKPALFRWFDSVFKGSADLSFPNVLEAKTLTSFEHMGWATGLDPVLKKERGFIWVSAKSSLDFSMEALCKRLPVSEMNSLGFVGAWNNESACFSVVGKPQVELLHAFYREMTQGNVAFAGLYLMDVGVAGVTLAYKPWLVSTMSHKIAEVQQNEYEKYSQRAKGLRTM